MVWKKGASVAIWGSGLNAEKVYVKYAGKYDIRIVVDNFKNKESIFNKKIVSAEEFFANNEFCNLKIIIASDSWEEISKQLKSKGLKPGEDFLPYVMLDVREIRIAQIQQLCRDDEVSDFVDCMKAGRKTAIFWGNCQINGLREFCIHNKEFCTKYFILRFPYLWQRKEILDICDWDSIWEKCDILILQKIKTNNHIDIRVSDEYRSNFVKKLNKACRIVKVPNLHFEGYYPQLTKEKRTALRELQWEGVHCSDGNILRMVDEGIDDREIIETIEKEDFYSTEYVKDYFELQLSKMREYEMDCSVKIADFLNKNEVLYYAPTHPHGEVVYELALRLLKYLKIEDTYIIDQQRVCYHLERIHYFHKCEYIYPSVLKGLNIVGYKDEHRINTFLYGETILGRDMLESYIAVCKAYRSE